MDSKRSLSGLASFIAIMIAAVLFTIEYAIGINGMSWARYLLIAKDVAVALALIFASSAYVKNSCLIVKILFYATIITYVVFAVLTYVQIG